MYEVQLVFHRVLSYQKNPVHGRGMDIYWVAKRQDKYPTLATDTTGGSQWGSGFYG